MVDKSKRVSMVVPGVGMILRLSAVNEVWPEIKTGFMNQGNQTKTFLGNRTHILQVSSISQEFNLGFRPFPLSINCI